MDFQTVVRRRKMVRSFSGEPVPDEILARILANALQAPSAGFSQGWAFVVLAGPSETGVFWEAISDAAWRAAPNRPGLLRAPVVIVPLTDEATYRARYREPDKAAAPFDRLGPGLGAVGLGAVGLGAAGLGAAGLGAAGPEHGPDPFQVPYWLVDTSFATMVILLSAVDAGLGALFFGLHGRQDELMRALGVPDGYRPIGAVALGWPDGQDRPSPSLARGRRRADSVIHRRRW